MKCSRCFTLELPGEIGGVEETGTWGRCVEDRGMYGCGATIQGFVYGFSLQICGQPFLSRVVVGIHCICAASSSDVFTISDQS